MSINIEVCFRHISRKSGPSITRYDQHDPFSAYSTISSYGIIAGFIFPSSRRSVVVDFYRESNLLHRPSTSERSRSFIMRTASTDSGTGGALMVVGGRTEDPLNDHCLWRETKYDSCEKKNITCISFT